MSTSASKPSATSGTRRSCWCTGIGLDAVGGRTLREIAAGGRFVIRFDNRDTGKSVSYPTRQPGYSLRDMTENAMGILDVLGIQRAHLVGRSAASPAERSANGDPFKRGKVIKTLPRLV